MSIVREFHPQRVLDVGCGPGELLQELASLGVKAVGLELAEAGIRTCREKGLDVFRCDVTRDQHVPDEVFDVVVSTEVGEHLPGQSADHYVSLLCRAGEVVLFSAATPGQGGRAHINEQPHQYWIERFECCCFRHEAAVTQRLRREWEQASVLPWYWKNVMCFVKRESGDTMA